MSRKKNVKAKAQARAEAERKAQTRRFRTTGVSIGMGFIGLALGLSIAAGFGAGTCGASEEAMAAFLEDRQGQSVEVLKVAENGRVKAALYETEDGQSVAVFQRRLLGLRWAYSRADGFEDGGLGLTGSWTEGGFLRSSRCDVEIYGDNRDGETAAYTLTDGVERSDLEADLILDIYILDGADALPDRSDLARYDAAGNTLEGSEGTL